METNLNNVNNVNNNGATTTTTMGRRRCGRAEKGAEKDVEVGEVVLCLARKELSVFGVCGGQKESRKRSREREGTEQKIP